MKIGLRMLSLVTVIFLLLCVTACRKKPQEKPQNENTATTPTQQIAADAETEKKENAVDAEKESAEQPTNAETQPTEPAPETTPATTAPAPTGKPIAPNANEGSPGPEEIL